MRALRREHYDTVGVTVTFLRMDHPPRSTALSLPPAFRLERVRRPSLAFYRYLYNTVGADYIWWLRRVMSDDDLSWLLREASVSIHVLYKDGEPAGFFELDARFGTNVNLSYFGLMPHVVGTGIGPGFLGVAVDTAWTGAVRTMTVNTCTADHPRALPNYLRAGFREMRTAREVWDIPCYLGLRIPSHLRV